MAQAATVESKFSNVIMFEQAQSLRNLKELSEKVESQKSEATDPAAKENEKRVDKLNDNLKTLSEMIKEQTQQSIKNALKNGFGQESAGTIQKNDQTRQQKIASESTTRKMLLGNQSSEDIKKGSWMNKIEDKTGLKVGKFSPSMAISGWLEKKEAKKAHEEEKKEFVKGALGNDKRAIALKNLKGEDYAKEDAGKRFEEMKAKEKEVAKAQKAIDESKAAGYSPKVKDIKARDAAVGELAMIDPRQKQAFAASGKKEAAGGGDAFSAAEDKQEAFATQAANDSKMVALQTAEATNETAMGATLIQSLEVQKEMLKSLQAGAASGGGGGGSMLGDAVDAASNMGKKGKGLLGKAGGFLKAAGPGLLKGGVGALGGMALEAGGDALKENGYEKTGGAVSTLGTAASYAGTGAMIGSVIPGVGTAIGAGVGGAIGLGKGLYDNWGSMFGGDKKKQEAAMAAQTPPNVEAVGPRSAGGEPPVAASSKNNENIKAEAAAPAKGNTSIVNAPTTINNNSSGGGTPRPTTRNPESSQSRYISSRYGT